MWSQFIFGCVFEAVSGALVAAAWLRMRKAERERGELGAEAARAEQEVAELRELLASNGQELLQHRAALETLQQGLPESGTNEADCVALRARCEELEAALRQQADLEEERLGLEQDLSRASHGRAVELEEQLARRDQELVQRAQLLEHLQGELAAKEQELQRVSAAGAGESEALRAERDEEANRRAAEFQRMRVESALGDQRIAALGTRCTELERELARTLLAAAGLEPQLDSLRSELARATADSERVQAEAAAKDARIETLVARSDALEREAGQALAAAAAESDAQLARSRRQLEDQAGAIARLAAEAAAKDACILEREARIDELRRAVTALEPLQGEETDKDLRIEALARRCAGLEQDLGDSAQREHELQAALDAREADFEGRLASRDAGLRAHTATVEGLEALVAEQAERIAELGASCEHLEQDLRARTEQTEQRRVQWDHQAYALTARAAELEARLAAGEEELRARAAASERLANERDAHGLEIETLTRRLGELETGILREREQAAGQLLDERERQASLAACVNELECEVSGRTEELQRALEMLHALRNETADAVGLLAEAREREALLEAELAAQAETSREALAGAVARADELELRLAGTRDAADGLRSECAKLTARCTSLWNLVETRFHALQQREQELGQAGASVEVLNFAVQSCHEELEATAALLDAWTENRVAALFQRRLGRHPGPLPEPYLDGLAQGDLELALRGLLGELAPLPAEALAGLCSRWQAAYQAWKQQPIEREIAYLWADGVHLEAGAEREDAALLVVVAAFTDGSRAVLSVESGERGSRARWLALLEDLSRRGMNAPRIVVADPALGVWSAIDELGWTCARQYCWSYQAAEVLAALPRERRARAAVLLREVAESDSRSVAKAQRTLFVKRCGTRHAAAGGLLLANWKRLLSYQAFPKEHWSDLRTADAVAAPLASIRLRAAKSKAGRPFPHLEGTLWRLLSAAFRGLPGLDALELVPSLVRGQPVAEEAREAVPGRRSR